ncbi:MIP/aquaporin family protein [Nesterenkonia alba]|uniref:MIP/aquaporin family protein n=1 Tax=Nesterenkonia alba TaxID=515814 RepID=UPI0003B71C88|nr:MIP/aquaporin family protein [Nesterenkonia alba]
MATIFLFETMGTAFLVLLGLGTIANAMLRGTKGQGVGLTWLMIPFGLGLAVFTGVHVAHATGGHINPAVTIGIMISGAEEFAPGIEATFPHLLAYLAAQFLGAMIGAVWVWLAYKNHFDEEEDPAKILGVFSTGPERRNLTWNTVTEMIGTYVLVLLVLLLGETPAALGPLSVALVVVVIGIGLGGPTGFSINPARDFGPRIIHAILPIPNKGSSDWGYSWVPVVGPVLGGVFAGISVQILPLLGG